MKRFAKAIHQAAQIHEDSFDHKMADKLEKSSVIIKNYNTCYKLTLYEAANKAVEELGFDEKATIPIYLLLKYAWNDILDWSSSLGD